MRRPTWLLAEGRVTLLPGINGFDWAIERAINGAAGHVGALDGLGLFFGQWGPLWIVLLYVAVWLRPAMARRPEDSSVSERALRLTVAEAAVAGVLSLVVNVLLSHVVYRERPFVLAPAVVHAVVSHAADSSFPSDHTAIAFGFASIAWLARYRLRGLMLSVAILTGLGRVYLGMHWPTDVLAAAAIGVLSGALVWSGRKAIRPVLAPLVSLAERLTPGARRGRPERGE